MKCKVCKNVSIELEEFKLNLTGNQVEIVRDDVRILNFIFYDHKMFKALGIRVNFPVQFLFFYILLRLFLLCKKKRENKNTIKK